MRRILGPKVDKILTHCIRRPFEPALMFKSLLRRKDFYEALGKGIKCLSPRKVQVK